MAFPNPQREMLTREAGKPGTKNGLCELVKILLIASLAQGSLQFETSVEIVFYGRFIASRDEHKLLDTPLARLTDDELNSWPIKTVSISFGNAFVAGNMLVL
jgi:hypothetical protein